MFGKAGLLLIEVNREQLEPDRRPALKIEQQSQQCVTVLTTTETDHNAVAVFDHVEVGDRASDAAQKVLFQFFSAHAFEPLKQICPSDLILACRRERVPRTAHWVCAANMAG
jgi:hypothetical protein